MHRPERARAAALFALAGMGAAALHVTLETPGALRDWRQTLPLAAALGAGLGWVAAPESAVRGALTAAGGLIAFAALFVLGHAAISGGGATAAFLAATAALSGPVGAAALALGALAGWMAGRIGPSSR